MNDDTRRAALIALQREIAGCRRCVEAGFIPAAHPIFRGGIAQRWMIVGQAPGAQAHIRDLPYSGATGKTLRSWLAAAGINEDRFFDLFYLEYGSNNMSAHYCVDLVKHYAEASNASIGSGPGRGCTEQNLDSEMGFETVAPA
jgi:hypothetical protein